MLVDYKTSTLCAKMCSAQEREPISSFQITHCMPYPRELCQICHHQFLSSLRDYRACCCMSGCVSSFHCSSILIPDQLTSYDFCKIYVIKSLYYFIFIPQTKLCNSVFLLYTMQFGLTLSVILLSELISLFKEEHVK